MRPPKGTAQPTAVAKPATMRPPKGTAQAGGGAAATAYPATQRIKPVPNVGQQAATAQPNMQRTTSTAMKPQGFKKGGLVKKPKKPPAKKRR
jgi:hypothetical protein